MKRRKGGVLMAAGTLLLALSAGLLVENLHQSRRAEQSANAALAQISASMPQDGVLLPIAAPIDPAMEMPVREIGGQEYIGVLEIPAKALTLPVISQWSDERLKVAPCRYSGSIYSGDIVIAGHNYASHFSRIKGLAAGDEVRFTDMDGNIFAYAVAQIETLRGDDVPGMQAGEWDLTLFTCTYGGGSRAAVRCTLLDTEKSSEKK